MTREQELMLQAVREEIHDRFERAPRHRMVISGKDLPAPVVNVELPPMEITNKIEPPAELNLEPLISVLDTIMKAIEANTKATKAQADAIVLQGKALEKLAKVLTDQKPPVVNVSSPEIKMPKIEIPEIKMPKIEFPPSPKVEAPVVNIEAPKREKRTLQIRHGDGTESTIVEM